MYFKTVIRKAIHSISTKLRPIIRALPVVEQSAIPRVIRLEITDVHHRQVNFNHVFDSIDVGNIDFIEGSEVTDEGGAIFFDVDANKFVESVVNQFKSDDDIKSISDSLLNEPKQRIVVEFSSPNIAKSFHVGHLRSTIIGNFVSNLNSFLGHDVIRLNYLGDWGTQYGLLSLGFDLYGDENALISNPISHLNEIYVKINADAVKNENVHKEAKERFMKLEKNTSHVLLDQWQRFRQLSLTEFNKTYQRLGVHFDHVHGESMYRNQECQNVIKQLQDRDLLIKDSDGAIFYKMNISKQVQEGGDVTCTVNQVRRGHRYTSQGTSQPPSTEKSFLILTECCTWLNRIRRSTSTICFTSSNHWTLNGLILCIRSGSEESWE